MSSGKYRRSPRIVELDAQKAQTKSQNKLNVTCEVTDEEELGNGEDILKEKRGRKKVKVKTVQDLVNSAEYKVQKTEIGKDEDGLINADIVPSGAKMPEKNKLERLVDVLQRRDTYKIFAEPVNADEVKHYYDVIKEPMDFGTISKKLNEGSYQTLEEFEYDVFLVPNNAMLFNASTTVYYRQARAIKELATRLFHDLKTDPENFEAEASIRRKGVRIPNCNSNKANTSIAPRGYGAQRRICDVDVERRRTYTLGKSFPSENGSSVPTFYNSPKQLVPVPKAGIGYVESLKQFSKDLGPIVEKVAMKKIKNYISEAIEVWRTPTNDQPWSPNMQIPKASFGSNIKVAPSIKVPSTGGQTSMDHRMTINNALTGGISQPGGRVGSLGDFQGNMTPSVSREFAPFLHLLENSNGNQTFADETMNSPSLFLNGGKVSAVNNADKNDALNKGKAKLGDQFDFQEEMLQPTRRGWDGGAAFKDYTADRSNGVHLDSSFPINMETSDALNSGTEKLGGGLEFLGKTLPPMRMGWDDGAAFKDSSFSNNVDLNDALNIHKDKGKLGDGMDFLPTQMSPPRVSLDGGIAFKDYSFPDNLNLNDPLNRGKGKLRDGIDVQEMMLQSMRVGLDGGATFMDCADSNQCNEVHSGYSFPNYNSGEAKLDFTALWNTKGKQKEVDETSVMVNPINVDNTVQKARHATLWWMQESMPKSIGGSSSTTLHPPSQVMAGLNGIQTIDFMSGIGSHYSGEGTWGKEVIADGEDSSYRTNVEQGGVVSDFPKPLEMGVQSSSEFCFQDETISAELRSLLEKKGESKSLYEAPTDWFGFFPQENVMGAPQKGSEYEKFQPESSGTATERMQKQTIEGAEQMQWRWL